MPTLTVTDLNVTNNVITITFSDPVNVRASGPTFPHSALNPANYTVFDPGSVRFKTRPPAKITGLMLSGGLPTASPGNTVVTFTFTSPEFQNGDWVTVFVRNVWGLPEGSGKGPATLEGDLAMIARQVGRIGTGREAHPRRGGRNCLSYSYRGGRLSASGYLPAGRRRRRTQLWRRCWARARADRREGDRRCAGVEAECNGCQRVRRCADAVVQSHRSRRPRRVEMESPHLHRANRSSGRNHGRAGQPYTRAKVAQDNALPLLDGLYPLDPTADPEYITALRDMAKSQITEIVKQFGVVPPSILRVNTYFKILLGNQSLRFSEKPVIESDPDLIGGTLGSIRDIYGIYFLKNGQDNLFSDSVEDEQDITNFRVISDYLTGLLQSWLANGQYFLLSTTRLPAFLGTQLVLISRQLGVIAETVNELRFALDSVFIGPNERQTLLLVFEDTWELPAMYLEDVLMEIESSVTDELPRLIKDGGRIAINNNLLPVVQTLLNMIQAAKDPQNLNALPDGFTTARVRHALDDLSDQLTQLFTLGQQVGMEIPGRLE